jgi:O-methyltransferase
VDQSWVRQWIDDYADAWRRGDAEALTALFSEDAVREMLVSTGYPEERLHFIRGPVEQMLPDRSPDRIALLRLDTDWYESTRHELEHLYPRLTSGGLLIVDDYGWWQGSRTAVDEFLEESGERLLLLRLDRGRIAVKP